MIEQSNTLKTKVLSLYEETPKPYPDPKISPLGPQKVKNDCLVQKFRFPVQ